jgi:poly(A) polymerase
MTRIEADWLKADATQGVFAMLTDAGFQAYAVGGCVRDSLLGMPVKDIDIATDAEPERVLSLAEAAGFHAVPTGIEHGTVTVVAHGVPHEVTTFRHDVETDGRRATVAFAGTMHEDARRRDFTMNALYADFAGQVMDPIGGLPDLAARRIRFIEDAATRIREDYLRSLRFFRFHAWYGDAEEGFDPEAIAAIASHAEGLANLSRERVGAELLKLLAAPDPAPAVAGMRTTGVLAAILPGSDDRALAPLVHLEETLGVLPDALRRLAVLGGEDLRDRLRLSRKDSTRLAGIETAASMMPGEAGYRLGAETATDGLLVAAASLESSLDVEKVETARHAAEQVFPIKAADLMPEYSGVELGRTMEKLEQEWIESGFELSRDTLLSRSGKQG